MTSKARPLPDLHDPLTAPFWAATRAGRLEVPRCSDCGYLTWPPEPVCPECQHAEHEWVEVAATGELWSFATYHRALDPAFADAVPYTVGLVQLDAGPKMYGLMVCDSQELHIGKRVRGVFERVDDEVTFVRWRIDDEVVL